MFTLCPRLYEVKHVNPTYRHTGFGWTPVGWRSSDCANPFLGSDSGRFNGLGLKGPGCSRAVDCPSGRHDGLHLDENKSLPACADGGTGTGSGAGYVLGVAGAGLLGAGIYFAVKNDSNG